MKKFVFTLLAIAMVATVNAQEEPKNHIGGSLGLWYSKPASTTTFTFAPEYIHMFNHKLAVGAEFAYIVEAEKNEDAIHEIELAPFVRYTFLRKGRVSLFMDGGFGVGVAHAGSANVTEWNIGITPGIEFEVSHNFCLEAKIGRLGVFFEDDELKQAGFGLSSGALSLGFGYHF